MLFLAAKFGAAAIGFVAAINLFFGSKRDEKEMCHRPHAYSQFEWDRQWGWVWLWGHEWWVWSDYSSAWVLWSEIQGFADEWEITQWPYDNPWSFMQWYT